MRNGEEPLSFKEAQRLVMAHFKSITSIKLTGGVFTELEIRADMLEGYQVQPTDQDRAIDYFIGIIHPEDKQYRLFLHADDTEEIIGDQFNHAGGLRKGSQIRFCLICGAIITFYFE